ncbi:hypothetical protein ACFW5S_34255 [Streptomyces olivaceus]|uniref:hypothetical protein n=1 Tax=Streptomyces olivaceus TaxID=47716 RepID=UPI0036D1A0A9
MTLLSALLIATAFPLEAAHAEEGPTTLAESGTLRVPVQERASATREISPVADLEFSCSPSTVDRELCVSVGVPSGQEEASASASNAGAEMRRESAVRASESELACSTGQLDYAYDRFNSCLGNFPVHITEIKDGKPVGTALMQVTAQMSLKQNSLTWKENIQIKYLEAAGNLTTTTFGISFAASCDKTCSMTAASPWAGEQSIRPGQTISGDVTFGVGTPNSGWNGGITTQYQMRFSQAGTIPLQPNTSWTNPQKIRCDDEVDGTASCVYPHVKPNLELPLSKYGEAAATYLFQQQYSTHAWGTQEEPLHRLANEQAQQDNRDRTCVVAAEGTLDTPELFVRKSSTIPDDSCDEYPFAASMEGGTPGAFCNDVEFELVDGEWIYHNANPSKPWTEEAPCSRGHVPFELNRNAGGELGRLVKSQRIIDLDGYTVNITE